MAIAKTDGLITLEALRAALSYDPATGLFFWKYARSNIQAGSMAGTTRKDGRRQISLGGQFYLASRLAWFYVMGSWPVGDVDHRDRNKSNDAFDNLRDASHGKNMANRAKWSGQSKFLGVHPRRGRWAASICSAGQHRRLGVFPTQELAAQAYNLAAAAVHGEFAVLNGGVSGQ